VNCPFNKNIFSCNNISSLITCLLAWGWDNLSANQNDPTTQSTLMDKIKSWPTFFFSQLRSTLIHYRTWKLPSMPTLHFHQATHKLNGWIRASPSLTQISVINLLQLHSGFYSCAEWTWINRKCAITPCQVRLAPPWTRVSGVIQTNSGPIFFLQSMV